MLSAWRRRKDKKIEDLLVLKLRSRITRILLFAPFPLGARAADLPTRKMGQLSGSLLSHLDKTKVLLIGGILILAIFMMFLIKLLSTLS